MIFLLKTVVYLIAFPLPSRVFSRLPRRYDKNFLSCRRSSSSGSVFSILRSHCRSSTTWFVEWFLKILRPVERLKAFVQTFDILLESSLHKNTIISHFLILFKLSCDPRHLHAVVIFQLWLVSDIVVIFATFFSHFCRVHKMLNVAKKRRCFVQNTFEFLWHGVVVLFVINTDLIIVKKFEGCDVDLGLFMPSLRYSL